MINSFAPNLLAIVLGGLVGAVFSLFPVPLPFLLGALMANALGIFVLPEKWTRGLRIPDVVRLPFIAIIGLLIGAQVHVEMIQNWAEVGTLLLMVPMFTPLAFAMNYVLFRKVVKYDRPTAIFSAAPGGLIEAIEFGIQAGANPAILMMQQFLRIAFVVTLVPFFMSIWQGHPVGSAAGLSMTSGTGETTSLIVIALIGAAGFAFGKFARLPAAQLTGPLIAAALFASLGWIQISIPYWLFIASQIVIGTALGLRFNGLDATTLQRGALYGLISVSMVLALGGVLTLVMLAMVEFSGPATFLSFAPGGVTEMSLVALSIAADPAIVTLAHVYRIVLTVIILSVILMRLKRSPSPPE